MTTNIGLESFKTIQTKELVIGPSLDHEIKEECDIVGKLLKCVTSKKPLLFLKLIERGILDKKGNLMPSYANVQLPSLTDTEIQLLIDELERPFDIAIDGQYIISTSIAKLLRTFIFHDCPCKVLSINLIGGYVSYFLLTQTNYCKRVFEKLKIQDLYEENLYKNSAVPSDIDLKIQVENFSHTLMSYHDIQAIRNSIITHMAGWFMRKLRKDKLKPGFSFAEVQDKIYNQAFQGLMTVYLGYNKFQLMSLEKFDLVFFNDLSRFYVFTQDELFLPVFSLFFDKTKFNAICPQSHTGKPLQSFFHTLLGFITTDNENTLDEKAWFRFDTLVAKGNTLTNLDEEKLYQVAANCFISFKNDFFKLKEEWEKWVKKHYSNNPLGIFAFVFKQSMFLKNKGHDQFIDFFWNSLKKSDLQVSSFALSIYELIVEHKVPFEIVESFLQVSGFLAAVKKSYVQEDVISSIGVKIISELESNTFAPTIELKVANQTLLFEFEPEAPLDKLNQFIQTNAKVWQKVEPLFSKLFFNICPFSFDADFEIDYDPSHLENEFMGFINSTSPFLQQLGLQFCFAAKKMNRKTRYQVIERQFLPQLQLASNKKILKEQFETVIVEIKELSLDDSEFETKWISLLFRKERDTEETAFEVWKAWFEQKQDIVFSLNLVKDLFYRQPDYALKILTYLKAQGALVKDPNFSYEMIRQYATVATGLANLTEVHKKFIDFAGKIATELLDIKEFKSPDKKKLFSRSFIWFAKWFRMRSDSKLSSLFLKVALNRSYLEEEDRKNAVDMRVGGKIKKIESSYSEAKVKKAYNYIKQETQKLMVTEEKKCDYLISLLQSSLSNDKKNIDSEIFKELVFLVRQKKISAQSKEEALDIIVTTLEIYPLFEFSFLYNLKTAINECIRNLSDLNHADNLRKRLLEQCYLKKLDIPHESIFIATVENWFVGTKDVQELQKIQNICTDAGDRKLIVSDELTSIEIYLAIKWLELLEVEKAATLFEKIKPINNSIYISLTRTLLELPEILAKVKFVWIDKIIKKLPSLKSELVNSVVRLGNRLIIEGNRDLLILWIVKTEFFNDIKDEEKAMLSVLMSTAFSTELESLNENALDNAQVKNILAIFNKHLPFLTCVKRDCWQVFFLLFRQNLAKSSYEAYLKLKAAKILESDLRNLATIFSSVASTLLQARDPQMILLVKSYDNEYNELKEHFLPEVAYCTHAYLLQAVIVLEKDQVIQNLPIFRRIYENSVNLDSIIFEENFKSFVSSQELSPYKAIRDFSFLLILFKTNKKELIEEANRHLQQLEEKNEKSVYWSYSVNLLNFLTLTLDEQHGPTIDKLLNLLYLVTPQSLDYVSLLNYLIKYPTLKRIHEAQTFWGMALENKVWQPNQQSWNFAKKIFSYLVEQQDEMAIDHMTIMIKMVNQYEEDFNRNLGNTFIAENCYFNFKYWVNIIDETNADTFFDQLTNAFHVLRNYYKYEERLLHAIKDVLIISYTLNPNKFFSNFDKFWNLCIIDSNKNRREMNKLLLAEKKCYEFKTSLLKDLNGLRILYDTDEHLITAVGLYIQKILEEFPKKMKEIKKLFT